MNSCMGTNLLIGDQYVMNQLFYFPTWWVLYIDNLLCLIYLSGNWLEVLGRQVTHGNISLLKKWAVYHSVLLSIASSLHDIQQVMSISKITATQQKIELCEQSHSKSWSENENILHHYLFLRMWLLNIV